MRKLPKITEPEVGKETLNMYSKMERIEFKICDYKNHLILTRVLEQGSDSSQSKA